jgi:hypothetical protein
MSPEIDMPVHGTALMSWVQPSGWGLQPCVCKLPER